MLFPKAGFSTDDLVALYSELAPVLLPHLKARPVTLKRFPGDIYGESFWEKNAPAFTPKWVKRAPVPRKSDPGFIDYITLADLRSLRWAASVGCIELHTFLHKYPYITQPTVIALDLDPGEGVHLPTCCRVALEVREWFSNLGMECFAKVSGSKGLQVYVPLNSAASYPLTEWIARRVAEELERRSPRRVTSRMDRVQRAGKVFIDWSQNSDYKTTVSVYSVRAKLNHPYLSAPVEWSEVEHANMHNLIFRPEDVLGRLKQAGDLFQPVLHLAQAVPEELIEESGLGTVPRAQPVRIPKSQGAHARSSRQGGRRRFAVRRVGSRFELSIQREEEFMTGSFASVPATKDAEVRGTAKRLEHSEALHDAAPWDSGTYEIVEGSFDTNVVNAYFSGTRLQGEWLVAVGSEGWIWRNNGGKVVGRKHGAGDPS